MSVDRILTWAQASPECQKTFSNLANSIFCLAQKCIKEVEQHLQNTSLDVWSPPQPKLFMLEPMIFTSSQGSPTFLSTDFPAPVSSYPISSQTPPSALIPSPVFHINIPWHRSFFYTHTPTPPSLLTYIFSVASKKKIFPHHFALHPSPNISLLQPAWLFFFLT